MVILANPANRSDLILIVEYWSRHSFIIIYPHACLVKTNRGEKKEREKQKKAKEKVKEKTEVQNTAKAENNAVEIQASKPEDSESIDVKPEEAGDKSKKKKKGTEKKKEETKEDVKEKQKATRLALIKGQLAKQKEEEERLKREEEEAEQKRLEFLRQKEEQERLEKEKRERKKQKEGAQKESLLKISSCLVLVLAS